MRVFQSGLCPLQFVIDRCLLPGQIKSSKELFKIVRCILPSLKEQALRFFGVCIFFSMHCTKTKFNDRIIRTEFHMCFLLVYSYQNWLLNIYINQDLSRFLKE